MVKSKLSKRTNDHQSIGGKKLPSHEETLKRKRDDEEKEEKEWQKKRAMWEERSNHSDNSCENLIARLVDYDRELAAQWLESAEKAMDCYHEFLEQLEIRRVSLVGRGRPDGDIVRQRDWFSSSKGKIEPWFFFVETNWSTPTEIQKRKEFNDLLRELSQNNDLIRVHYEDKLDLIRFMIYPSTIEIYHDIFEKNVYVEPDDDYETRDFD